MGMCGDQFWDDLVTHPDVVNTYKNWSAAADLRKGTAFQGGEGTTAAPKLDTMSYGGIEWFNYRGSDDATTVGVPTSKVKFFPRRAPGVFREAMAPHPAGPFLGTPGKKEYVVPEIDIQGQEWWRMKVYAYPLFICTRPE